MEFTNEELDMLAFVYHKGMLRLVNQGCPFFEQVSIDEYDTTLKSLPDEVPEHVKNPEAMLRLGIKLLNCTKSN